jgi:hypothetical protein
MRNDTFQPNGLRLIFGASSPKYRADNVRRMGGRGLQLRAITAALFVFCVTGPVGSNVHAQQFDRGLRVSLSSGFISGGGQLWSIDALPRFLPASGLSKPSPSWDTLATRQGLSSGPVISVALAGPLSSVFSLGGNFVISMLKTDNHCHMVFNSFPTTTNPDPVICETVDDEDGPFATVDLMPVLELRYPGRGSTRPYARLGAGLSNISNTTTQAVRAGDLVREDGSSSVRPAFQAFLGIESLETDSGLIIEFGVVRHRYDTISGVNPDATVAVGRVWRNHFSLRVGVVFSLDA